MENNKTSLDTLCSTLCYAMGIPAPSESAEKNEELSAYIDEKLKGKKADRIFMYNPDAIAQWIFEKYPELFKQALSHADVQIPLCSVMPSVTPVCFATMYTGAQPSVHGIQQYEKPVIKIETIFDSLIKSGKKGVIVATDGCSLSRIYCERDMDYFFTKSSEESNAIAARLIIEDKYDFYVVYNGNYDTSMHKMGTESVNALSEIRANSRIFGMFSEMIKNHWKNHNTLVGFAMDHGCHDIDKDHELYGRLIGFHGIDIPEDMNIVHLYKIYESHDA